MTMLLNLKIFDETLRDGEQQAGVYFNAKAKEELAYLIAQTGVHRIDLMPSIAPIEEELVKSLVQENLAAVITPATMMGKRFIDHAKSCGVKRIILFHAVSDRLLFLRDQDVRKNHLFSGKTIDTNIPEMLLHRIRRNMIRKVVDNLKYATSEEVGLKVDFAAEDASRANHDFLVDCINQFSPYLEYFMLCDTVGILSPDRSYKWVSQLLEQTNDAPLAVHFHNDMGLALENTLQAIVAGASMISGTFSGIGERAGNVAIEQVLNGLKVRFGVEVDGIDYDAIQTVITKLNTLGYKPAAPYSCPAQWHETGIHVNSILYDRKSYSIFDYEQPEIWFGKCSGASNFQYLFEKCLNHPLPANRYRYMRSVIKDLAIQEERSYSTQEVIDLYEKGVFDA